MKEEGGGLHLVLLKPIMIDLRNGGIYVGGAVATFVESTETKPMHRTWTLTQET